MHAAFAMMIVTSGVLRYRGDALATQNTNGESQMPAKKKPAKKKAGKKAAKKAARKPAKKAARRKQPPPTGTIGGVRG